MPAWTRATRLAEVYAAPLLLNMPRLGLPALGWSAVLIYAKARLPLSPAFGVNAACRVFCGVLLVSRVCFFIFFYIIRRLFIFPAGHALARQTGVGKNTVVSGPPSAWPARGALAGPPAAPLLRKRAGSW